MSFTQKSKLTQVVIILGVSAALGCGLLCAGGVMLVTDGSPPADAIGKDTIARYHHRYEILHLYHPPRYVLYDCKKQLIIIDNVISYNMIGDKLHIVSVSGQFEFACNPAGD